MAQSSERIAGQHLELVAAADDDHLSLGQVMAGPSASSGPTLTTNREDL